jgi:hypothetical protein
MHRSHRMALLAVFASLAACQDDSSTPTAAPEAAGVQESRTETLPATGPWVEGYILGHDGKPRLITYQVHNGHAIWQGDIDLGPAASIPRTAEQLRRPQGPRQGVTIDGVSGGTRWWRAIVPYYIDGPMTDKWRVTDAIAHIELKTNAVDFVPATYETDVVRFSVIPDGCGSAVGRQGGVQVVQLAANCSTGNVIHELLHVLGMDHEQNRCDRNSYVQIQTANIDPNRLGNFAIACDGFTDIFGYDEGSIMHYDDYDFSINGQPTILSLRGLASRMGQRNGLSAIDISTVDWMYPTPPPLTPAPSIYSLTTSPSPAKQYLPFTVTINGAGFDPALVEVRLVGAGSCPSPGCKLTNFSSKTATQLVVSISLSMPGTYTLGVRNGRDGNWSTTGHTVTVAPMY